MTEITPKTNGDRVDVAVKAVKDVAAEAVRQVREHPDELLVALAPIVICAVIVARNDVSFIEEQLLMQCVALPLAKHLVKDYRAWKARPASASILQFPKKAVKA